MGGEQVTDEVSATMDTHLVKNGFQVILHCVRGDVQGGGDDAGGFAAQNENGDLGFTRGQAVRGEHQGCRLAAL